jgi:hypothetical protein
MAAPKFDPPTTSTDGLSPLIRRESFGHGPRSGRRASADVLLSNHGRSKSPTDTDTLSVNSAAATIRGS